MDPATEAKGIAMTGMCLAYGLISRLQAKGILSDADLELLFEGSLATLESQPPDHATALARQTLEAMANVARRSGPKASQ